MEQLTGTSHTDYTAFTVIAAKRGRSKFPTLGLLNGTFISDASCDGKSYCSTSL